jgi:hopene-associated glycosyltransferase HpnB
MLIACGSISLLIWLYLFLAHGRFWEIERYLLSAGKPTDVSARVAVIIPARDEAEVVGRSITSLLNQTGSHALHIYLIDDRSSDGTAEVARSAARAAEKSGQLTTIAGCELAPGWSGKLWAVQQGVETALRTNPDFLLLTDADIEHALDSVASLVQVAESRSLDLVSVMVKLHCCTFAEKALIPAFVFFFFKLYPPARIRNPRRRAAGAAGGCILIRPEALERAGGIPAIRGEVIDDCALARRVKAAGGRLWLGLSATTASTRPYGTFAAIGRMISRGAFNQLQHSSWMLLLAMLGLSATYLLPPLLVVFTGHLVPTVLGAAAWLLMIVCFLPMVRFYGLKPLWAAALPLISIFYMAASVDSALRFWSGRGGQWKGRIQDPGWSGQSGAIARNAEIARDRRD